MRNVRLLTMRRSLSVCPDERTFSKSVGMCQRCRGCYSDRDGQGTL